MIIRTKGKPQKASIRECKLAIKFAASQLLSTKMQSNLDILLRFDEEEFLTKKDWDGYCDWLDSNLKPRSFEISCHPKLSLPMLYKVQFHEMAHVKQYATGQMKDYVRMHDVVGWMGKLHKDSRGDNATSPWELDALRVENQLYKKFKEYLDTV